MWTSHAVVMAGLVPATPINTARPCPDIGVAGTSPAMTAHGCVAAQVLPTRSSARAHQLSIGPAQLLQDGEVVGARNRKQRSRRLRRGPVRMEVAAVLDERRKLRGAVGDRERLSHRAEAAAATASRSRRRSGAASRRDRCRGSARARTRRRSRGRRRRGDGRAPSR